MTKIGNHWFDLSKVTHVEKRRVVRYEDGGRVDDRDHLFVFFTGGGHVADLVGPEAAELERRLSQ